MHILCVIVCQPHSVSPTTHTEWVHTFYFCSASCKGKGVITMLETKGRVWRGGQVRKHVAMHVHMWACWAPLFKHQISMIAASNHSRVLRSAYKGINSCQLQTCACKSIFNKFARLLNTSYITFFFAIAFTQRSLTSNGRGHVDVKKSKIQYLLNHICS